jgi:hypothetical protein
MMMMGHQTLGNYTYECQGGTRNKILKAKNEELHQLMWSYASTVGHVTYTPLYNNWSQPLQDMW